jgi:urea transporter
MALGGNLKFSLKQLLTTIMIGSIIIIVLQRPIRLLLTGEWVCDFWHGVIVSFWPLLWLCYNEHLIDTTARPGVPEAAGLIIGVIVQILIGPILTRVFIDRSMSLWKRLHTGETFDRNT